MSDGRAAPGLRTDGLATVLGRAAADGAFRARLLADRAGALGETTLLPSERQALAAVPERTLVHIIESLAARRASEGGRR